MSLDRDVDAVVAENLFGWQWFLVSGVNVLFPPLALEHVGQSPALYAAFDPAKPKCWTPDEEGREQGYFFDSSKVRGTGRPDDGFTFERFPDYTSDIKFAWQVVDKMVTNGFEFKLEKGPENYIYAAFVPSEEIPAPFMDGSFIVGQKEEGMSAEFAICISALKALGIHHIPERFAGE